MFRLVQVSHLQACSKYWHAVVWLKITRSRIAIWNSCGCLNEMGGTRSSDWGWGEACTGFLWGHLRERDHWGDPDVKDKIILRWIFRNWDVGEWNGLSCLRIVTGGGHLWVREWTFGFHKVRGISWLAANRLASQGLLHGVSNANTQPYMPS
jgi:hypothetical protein